MILKTYFIRNGKCRGFGVRTPVLDRRRELKILLVAKTGDSTR